MAIEHIFGMKSRHISDFNEIRYTMAIWSGGTPSSRHHEKYVSGLRNAEAVLTSMIEEVDEYWTSENEIKGSTDNAATTTRLPSNNKVFVIHGHDSGTKETVARFLTKIGLEPIILHEQPNQSRTIIEKFEDFSDVSYAIAILTPDDIGAPAHASEAAEPRARQNVIFEFGFFMGKLGREHVAGLLKDKVVIPSDYSGVLYIPFGTSDAWKFLLVKELKAAGFDVDANKAI